MIFLEAFSAFLMRRQKVNGQLIVKHDFRASKCQISSFGSETQKNSIGLTKKPKNQDFTKSQLLSTLKIKVKAKVNIVTHHKKLQKSAKNVTNFLASSFD